METILEQIPESGEIRLTIQITARFNFSADAAQKFVRRFVADEIAYLLRAERPTLVVGKRLVWRVPVVIALPGRGMAGQAGTIDVDVEDGRLLVTPDVIAAIAQRAKELTRIDPQTVNSAYTTATDV